MQITIFDDPVTLPRVDEVSNDDIRVVGSELVFGRIFDYIGINRIPDQLFRDLVISRITHPGSKLQVQASTPTDLPWFTGGKEWLSNRIRHF